MENRKPKTENRPTELLAAIVESSDDAIVSTDLEGIVTSWNPAAERIYGYKAEEIVGRSKGIAIPVDMPEELPSILRRIRAGERIEHYETSRIRKDGSRITLSISVSPVQSPDGAIVGAATIARDITQRKREETAALILAKAGEILAGSLDYRGTLEQVGDLVVPRLADWCVIDLVRDGRIDRVAAAHVEPARRELARDLTRRFPPSLESRFGVAEVIRTGQAQVVAEITEEMLRVPGREEEYFRALQDLGLRSGICVPMAAHGKVLGAITLILADGGRRYGPEDLTLAQELARRAGLAVDGALLYESAQREIERRERTEEALRSHQAEIEALNQRLRRAMQETHHRVRNNLQLIAALADMQAAVDRPTVPREELERIGGQVRALAAVHEILTREAGAGEDASDMSSREMLEKLATLIRETTPAQSVTADVQDVRLSARQGSSLAVIANELATNALKHGADHVTLRFTVDGDVASLHVEDNGPGFQEDFELPQDDRAGLSLVRHIAQWDLQGSVQFANRPGGGGIVTLTMPLTPDAVPA